MKPKIHNDRNAAFYKKLFSLVLPIAFQQFMLAAVSASDALMLGFVNQDSLSAVSLAGQITFVFNLFMGGLTMGTSILAAQYYGKGDMISIEKIFAYVIKVSFLISAIFFLATLFIPETLMRIFTNEPQLISSGIVYLRVVAASYLFTGISQIYLCILKNTGCAVKSMVIGSTAVVINIFLNAALIYGLLFFPEMGIAGAALATSISKLIEMGWAYLESLREKRARLRIKILLYNRKKSGAGLLEIYNADAWRLSGMGLRLHDIFRDHGPLRQRCCSSQLYCQYCQKSDSKFLYRAWKRRRYYRG